MSVGNIFSEDRVLTAEEVAVVMRVSKATILRLHRSGRLQAIPVRGRTLFLASAVMSFLHGSRLGTELSA